MDSTTNKEDSSMWEDIGEDEGEPMAVEEVDPTPGSSTSKKSKKKSKKTSKGLGRGSTYLPGMELSEGETLVCEESAYITLHTFTTTSPCLSFDIIPDNLGPDRTKFPITAYSVAGTQAQRAHANHLLIMKMTNVYKTLPKSESDDEELSSDESEDEDEEEKLSRKPELTVALLPHHGSVNRVRFNFVGGKPLAASWSELGKVCLWDLTIPLTALDDVQKLNEYIKEKVKPRPIFEFKGHRGEGFALDWSPTEPGVLATGDVSKFIHVWRPTESGWAVDQRPFSGHSGSVEDIQWSPNEPNVFASCSADKSIRIWDARSKPGKGSLVTKESAHEKDVNVIHWNRKDSYFLASGGDDCALRVWDLRAFDRGECVAEFKHHHKAPVTSVEWSPTESTVLASAGEDDQIAIWDLAVEKDSEEVAGTGDGVKVEQDEDIDVPPQLLFIHQGQQDIKELHWHSQIPGLLISTAANNFNVFKPSNL